MADLGKQISEARGRGYSDDEILGYLGTAHQDLAPKIKEAQGAGYGAADILGHLAAPPPPAQHWAEKAGIQNPIAKGAVDLAEGAAAGLASTVFHGGDLIRRGLGMDRVIDTPEVQAHMAAPDSLMGKAGKFLEQAGEFVVPGAAAAKAAKGFGLAARIGAEGLAAGGVSALQTGGDPQSTAVGALAGAAGPALGGMMGAAGKGELPAKLYQSALKPGKRAMLNGTGEKAIQAALENEIPVSAKGVERLHGLVDDLNTAIQDKINAGAARGVAIDPAKVALRTDDIAARFGRQVNPEADLAAIDASKAEFLNGPGAGPIPADMAQQLKQGTYQQIRQSYGKLSSAQVEAQKALARGLKEELVAAFPEIADLNAKESGLLGLEPLLESAVARIGNHQMFGIGTPLAAAGVHAATGSAPIAATAGVLRSLIDNPAVKSRLAIALTKAGKGGMATAPFIDGRLAALKAAIEAAASKTVEGRGQPTAELLPAAGQ